MSDIYSYSDALIKEGLVPFCVEFLIGSEGEG